MINGFDNVFQGFTSNKFFMSLLAQVLYQAVEDDSLQFHGKPVQFIDIQLDLKFNRKNWLKRYLAWSQRS